MDQQNTDNSELLPDYQTSPTSGASPAQSPYSNRAFWGSYKSLSRGLWGGIMVGSVLGACVGGLASLAVVPFLGMLGAGTAVSSGLVALGITGSFAFAGMLYYAEKFSIAGATAGAVSTALEIYEERKAEDAFAKGETLSLSQKQMLERKNQHNKGELKNDYTPENNPSDERFQPYYWKVGLAGAALGAAVGLLLHAFGGGFSELVGHFGTAEALPPVPPVTPEAIEAGKAIVAQGEIAPSLMSQIKASLDGLSSAGKLLLLTAGGAAAGSTFGINRYYLRQPFYLANALFEGDLEQFTKQREHERELTRQYTKTGRIEPNLEELAPSAYTREHEKQIATPYQANAISSVPAAPGNVVKEASWGFELQAKPGPHGEKDATIVYSATASKDGKALFEKTFHGSWEKFQDEMKKELETSATHGRQA